MSRQDAKRAKEKKGRQTSGSFRSRYAGAFSS